MCCLRYVKRTLLGMCFLGLIPGAALAQDVSSYSEIDASRAIYCVTLVDDLGYFNVIGKLQGDTFRMQGAKRWKKKYKRIARNYNRKAKKANFRGDTESAAVFQAAADEASSNIDEIISCMNGDGLPDDGGNGGGGDNGGGGGDGGDSDACLQFGDQSSNIVGRIINGTTCSNPTAVVLIEMYLNSSSQGSCSGTYVGDDSLGRAVIMFAAHCLDGNINSVRVSAAGQTHTAVSFAAHPDWGYGSSTEYNDVAVAILGQSLSVPQIPICTQSSDISTGETGYIAGYGLNDNLDYDGQLRAARVVISHVGTNTIRTQYNLGDATGGTCNGDSGGPIIVTGGNNAYCVAGATSWGTDNDCGTGGSDDAYYSNFTEASNLSFIAQQTDGIVD